MKRLFLLVAICSIACMSFATDFITNLPAYTPVSSAGDTAKLQVEVPLKLNNSVSFKWYYMKPVGKVLTWEELVDATAGVRIESKYGSSKLSFPMPALNTWGGWVKCEAIYTPKVGTGETITSNFSKLVPAVSISSQPSDVEYTQEDLDLQNDLNITVVASAAAGTLSYQWYDAEDHSEISEATSATFPAMESGVVSPYDSIYCVVKSSYGNEQQTDVAKIYQVYQLWVTGKQVTSLNADDILGDGKMSYNGYVLAMDNVTWSDPDPIGDIVFVRAKESVSVSVIGTCSISLGFDGKGFVLDEVEGNTMFIGGNQLNIAHGDGDAIRISSEDDESAYLNIQDLEELNITTNGGGLGILGDCGSYLSIENSSVYSETPICDFKSIVIDKDLAGKNGEQVADTGYLKSCGYKLQSIVKNDKSDLATNIAIEPIVLYPIWWLGTQISDINASDVMKNGMVSFNAEENVLTVNGLSCATPNCVLKYNSNKTLILDIKGNNLFTSSIFANTFQFTEGSLVIRGTNKDTLSLNNGSNTTRTIVDIADTLTIKGGCVVNIEASHLGNNGVMVQADFLRVDSSTLVIKALHADAQACVEPVLVNAVVESGAYNQNNIKIVPENSGTALTIIKAEEGVARKVMYQNHLLIERGGAWYDAMGKQIFIIK